MLGRVKTLNNCSNRKIHNEHRHQYGKEYKVEVRDTGAATHGYKFLVLIHLVCLNVLALVAFFFGLRLRQGKLIHESVPILTCRKLHENNHRVLESLEVVLAVNSLLEDNLAEEVDAESSEDEE